MSPSLTICTIAILLSAAVAVADAESHVLLTLTAEETQRIEPSLSDTYFRKGLPSRYLRHRLVRVDKEKLQHLLELDLQSKENGELTDGVALHLFDDLIVRVTVDQAIRNEQHGATGYFGRGIFDRPAASTFNSYFHDSGHFKAVLRTDTASYLIENVLDYTYFVILAQKPLDHPID